MKYRRLLSATLNIIAGFTKPLQRAKDKVRLARPGVGPIRWVSDE
jgi:hypothetical protein